MKPDRRTFIIVAAILAAVVLLSARQGQRSACPGGLCCPAADEPERVVQQFMDGG